MNPNSLQEDNAAQWQGSRIFQKVTTKNDHDVPDVLHHSTASHPVTVQSDIHFAVVLHSKWHLGAKEFWDKTWAKPQKHRSLRWLLQYGEG